MYMNHRPQFKNFPLSAQDVRQLNQTKQSLSKQLQTNQRQIQELSIKTSQNNYETQLVKRLQQKNMIIRQRIRQNEQILSLQATMQRQIKYKKAQTLKQRKQLAEQYKSVIQSKKVNRQRIKQHQQEMERQIQKKNERIQEQVQKNKRNKQQARRKDYISSIQVIEMVKKQIKQQKQKNKRESTDANRVLVKNDEQFQKHYKQYKQSFMNNSSYSNSPPKATFYQNGILNATIDTSLMQQNINNMEKYKRDQQNKLQLQDSLKQQIEWRDYKKNKQMQQNRFEKQMTDLYILRNAEADRIQKQIKRQKQKQYEQDLNRQVQIKQFIASRQRWREGNNRENSLNRTGKMSNMATIGNNILK